MSNCLKCGELLESDSIHYGLHKVCFCQSFGLIEPITFKGLTRRASTSKEADHTTDDEIWNSSFFQGKFKKYSAELNETSYIIKIKEDLAPELPEVEYVCNQIAAYLQLPIPDFHLIEFYENRAFVTKNFISKKKKFNRLEHIYHYVKSGEEYTCETLLEIISKQTRLFADIELFIKTCLYDALIGNHDRHGRNLALIVSASQKELSPIYDNTSALGLEHGEILKATFNPKGKIFTKTSSEPTMCDYVAEFKRLGYRIQVENFYKKINLENIINLIQKSYCSSLMKTALINLITARYKELSDAL